MKRLTRIFQALLGAGALIVTSLIASGRLAWRSVNGWMGKRPKWARVTMYAALALVLPVSRLTPALSAAKPVR